MKNSRRQNDINAERAAMGVYNPPAYASSQLTPFVIQIKEADGIVRPYVEDYPTLEIAQLNAEARRDFLGDLEVVSVEALPAGADRRSITRAPGGSFDAYPNFEKSEK